MSATNTAHLLGRVLRRRACPALHRATSTQTITSSRTHSVPASYPNATHTANTLTPDVVGAKVVLAGWIIDERKAGKKLSFWKFKAKDGVVQLVVSQEVRTALRDIPRYSTMVIEGTAQLRPEHQRRLIPGGSIDILVDTMTVLNRADRFLPFDPQDKDNLANEHLRLRYRYLDLRRDVLGENLKKRSEVVHLIRTVFHEKEFTEVETPMLLRSTPEGAREFLVPTRLSATSMHKSIALPKGIAPPDTDKESFPYGLKSEQAIRQPLFYALAQSPQQPKQLLVASGAVDRYFQFARCFRDEDGRKDRQPEFTQVDLEMAWVSWGDHAKKDESPLSSTGEPAPRPTKSSKDPISSVPSTQWRIGGSEVRDVVEEIVRRVWAQVEGVQLPQHFRVMTYQEAMSCYGSDKPDLRYGLEIQNITQYLPPVLQEALSQRDEVIEAFVHRNWVAEEEVHYNAAVELNRTRSTLVESHVVLNAANTAWFSQSQIVSDIMGVRESRDGFDIAAEKLNELFGLNAGGIVWLSRRPRRLKGGSTALGRVRTELATLAQSMGDLIFTNEPQFLWVVEFPLFTHADADKEFLAHGRWSSSHHPFTAPMWQDIPKMYNGQIAEVRGQHYDLVLNGVEIGGGSVRIHDADMQQFVFEKILRLNVKEQNSFNHLLHALRCGAPPHGGFAFGFDRLMSIICKTESIRDVIAFPKTGNGTDLLFRSPSEVGESVMAEYGIRAA